MRSAASSSIKLTFDDTPWDRFLAGRDDALTPKQLAGAQTFMSIKCSLCHNGATFSDEKFHNVAVAQFGPGKGNGPIGCATTSAARTSPAIRRIEYRFRTSPLRNVELTAPYGHDGAITSLSRVHRALQRVGQEAARVRSAAARSLASLHAPSECAGRHRAARHDHHRRGAHRLDHQLAHRLHERAHRRPGTQSQSAHAASRAERASRG